MQFIWTLLGQQPRLECWENRDFWPGVAIDPGPGAVRDTHEREIAIERLGEPEASGPYYRLASAIFAFDIFPPRLVASALRRQPVEVGDTVGICYHLLPGMDLFFAARVMDRFDERYGDIWKCGFTYRTFGRSSDDRRGNILGGKESRYRPHRRGAAVVVKAGDRVGTFVLSVGAAAAIARGPGGYRIPSGNRLKSVPQKTVTRSPLSSSAPTLNHQLATSARPAYHWSSCRSTSWYSVSRSTGIRPASSISRRSSGTVSSCGESEPAS